MRKLASIRKILALDPIPGADAIVVATIDGWKVVVKKDEFSVGELCVYFEIDSFLPIRPQFEFLRKACFKKLDGEEGFRLKTIKLRGQVSQGLAIKIDRDLEIDWSHCFFNFEGFRPLQEGDNLTELLGVKKYEVPIPAELAGKVRGDFPKFIKRTDQERCQNLVEDIFIKHKDTKFEVTTKLDGTSFTAFYVDGEEGVCGRNWEMQIDGSNEHNTLVRMYKDSGLQGSLRDFGKNYAIQGELMGPGIQGNHEGFNTHTLFIFGVYDIDGGCYVPPEQAMFIASSLWPLGLSREMVKYVPVNHMSVTLAELGITNLAELLAFAEGPSIKHLIREGLVFKSEDGTFSFKVISNKFLLKEVD